MAKPTEVGTLDENLSNVEESTLDGKSPFYANFCKQLFTDGNFSDVTLIVGDKRYPAHKSILSASSPFFERMFYGGSWEERSAGEVKLEETPSCEDAFEMFLRYFYSGTVTVTNKTVVPIVTLADKYDVQGLTDICTKSIAALLDKKADVEAALRSVNFAEQMRMHALYGKCYDLICFNFEKACNLSSWLSLSLQQLLTILERSDVVTSNEYTVYEAVQKWLMGHSCTEDKIKCVLSYIQFKNMDAKQLCEVEKSQLASLDICKENHLLSLYLSDAFRYLAVRDTYPEGINEPAEYQRIYLESEESLRTADFSDNGGIRCAKLMPDCKVTSETQNYTWELGKFDSSDKYQIRIPTVSRRYHNGYRRYLYSHLSGDIWFKLILMFRNGDGRTIEAMRGSFKSQIPQENGKILVEFPKSTSTSILHDDECIPHEVKYSFSIETV